MPVTVWILAFVAWLYFVSLDMYATGLPLALTAAGATESWVGFIAGLMGLAAVVQRPFLAAWGDRRGHGPLLRLSLLAAIAAGGLYAAGGGPAAQVAARILQGTSLAGLIVASQALMAAAAPPAVRGRALALQGLADTGGVLLGPALGDWVWQVYGGTGLFMGAAALALVALLVAVFLLPAGSREVLAGGGDKSSAAPAPATDAAGEGVSGRPAVAEVPGARVLPHRAAVLVMGLAIGTVFGAVLNLTVLHARATGYEAGVWLGAFAVVAMGARYGAGFLADRGWDAPLLPAAFAVMAAGSALMIAAATPPVAYAAAAVVATGYGAAHTTLVTRVVARAPARRRGVAAGWVATAIDLGVGLGVTALGAILELFSFAAMYAAMAAAALAGAAAAWISSTGRAPRPDTSRSG